MATVPTFRTWVTGEIVTAAELNSNVRDAGNFFLSTPVAELRQTIAQSLTSGAGIPITFDTEDIDTDNGHSTVTNTSRYTAQTAGRYQLSGGVGYAANTGGIRQAVWAVNGSLIAGGAASVNTTATALACDVPARTKTVFLNGTTDYVELWGLHTASGALNTNVASADQPNMTVRWIGPT